MNATERPPSVGSLRPWFWWYVNYSVGLLLGLMIGAAFAALRAIQVYGVNP